MRTKFLLLLLILTTLFSCGNMFSFDDLNYREEMRSFVKEISEYAKKQQPDFSVIPQNGHPLVMRKGDLAEDYLQAVDALAQESFLYGYPDDDLPTPVRDTNRLLELLNKGKEAGKTILITDYCTTDFKVADSYNMNRALGFVSFAAPDRDLRVIPEIPETLPGKNDKVITKLSEAKNFLYLLNKSKFDGRKEFIEAIQNTNYDLIITDAFYGSKMFSRDEVEQLRQKRNGGKRLVISYMSIGEAEDYRFYWKDEWSENNPDWLAAENPNWPGNFKVKYWDPAWKSVIYGTPNSYLQQILNSEFDGVYLDIIDGFRYFE